MNQNVFWRIALSALIWVFTIQSRASLPPIQERLANYDQRVETPSQTEPTSAEQKTAVAELRANLPQAQVEFSKLTGVPAMVSTRDGFLSPGRGRTAPTNPYGPTRSFLREHTNLFGHGVEALDQARIKREFVTPHNGLRTVVWEQQVDGIGVFEGVLISHTTANGALVNISSQFLPDVNQAATRGTPTRVRLVAGPEISARQAVAAAAQNVGDEANVEGIEASAAPATGPEKAQEFRAPFLQGESETKLTWLAMDRENLRLCWDVVLTSRKRGEMFRILVDSKNGDVLIRRCLTDYLSDVTYRVFTSDSPSPMSPGYPTPVTTQPPLVSRTLLTIPALDTNASPSGWIDDGGNETRGNNVDAHTDHNNDNHPDVPRPQGSPFRVFDFPLDLTQNPTAYSQASVVQLFYLCNWMHDKLYELGFTEAAGNFQSNNFGRGGLGNDAVQADAQDGGGANNANFSTPPDGSAGRMQMYIFNGTAPGRDGSLDAEVVLHEYTHGLSNRRVGGGVGISALQSAGMGEGWSDFYALSLLSGATDDVNAVYANGGYVTYHLSGLTQNYYFGIRRYPYCTDMTKNPLTFKDVDPSQASSHPGIPRSPIIGSAANEVHNMGEVWCVTLWEARANLVNLYGWAVGNQLILQLVTDGMNLSPANPNFLQARDAILQADLVDSGGANRAALWSAFAKRGMGFSASAPASSTSTGIHEAFDVPDDLQITPTVLSASGPIGGPFTPNPSLFTLANNGSNMVSWALANPATWADVSPLSGTLPAGGPATNISVSVNASASSFNGGVYTATIWFTNQTSGVAQSRSFKLSVVGKNMFDDFEPGIDLSQWSDFGGTVGSTILATNYGGSISGVNALWFGDSGSRYATTVPLDTSSGGAISFYLHLANGSTAPWENVDLPGEGILLEYSTNNGVSWVVAGNYNTPAYYNWTLVTLPIPAGAQAPVTEFRWRQASNSGSGLDHWALDDVFINAAPLAPSFVSQPQSLAVFAGESAVFNPTVIGSQPLSYQWRLNGTNLSGATGGSFMLTNAQFSDAGTYSLVVSNPLGTTISSNAVLSVNPPPPCVAPPSGLVSWWPAEGSADDNVGGNNGVLVNGATFGSGEVGQAFSFDGSGNHVEVAAAPSLDVGKGNGLTIEAWINPGDLASGRPIVEWVVGGTYGVHFWINAGGSGSLYGNLFGTDGNSHIIQSAPSVIVGNVFQHVAITYDKASGVAQLFVNGVVVANSALGNFTPKTSSNLYLGYRPAGSPFGPLSFIGRIDEVSLFDRALSAGEIQGIYNARSSGKCSTPSAPVVLTQPQDQTVVAGSTASFGVTVSGTPPLRYQWRFNGADLAGSTTSALTLSNVQPTQAGVYAVQVTNGLGSIVSSNAALTVVTAPFNGVTNGSFEFGLNGWTTEGSVTVQGPPSGPAAGTDGTHSANIGAYDAVGSGLFQTLNVLPGTNYLLSFDSAANSPSLGRTSVVQVVVHAGAQVLTSALITDVAVLPTGGTNGFTPRSLSFVAPDGVFSVTLEFLDQSPNGGQGVDTMIDNVRLLLGQGAQSPMILTQPQSQTVNAGGTASFGVEVSGTGPFSYQWAFNGTNLAGASSSTLTLTSVQLTQAGSYAVQVTNSVGSIMSSNAVLTVVTIPFNGVTNGSFEFGLNGWTTTGAVTVQGPPSGGTAAGTDGTHAANIGAFDATGSGLFQTLNVVPGTNYLLSFDSAANSPSLGRTGVVQVVVQAGAQVLASTLITDVAVLPTGGTNGFTARSLSFAVPDGVFSLTLEFLDQSPNGGQGVDTMIDNVRLFPGQAAQAPMIVSQPQSQTINAGGTANFSVAASGISPFSYQWRFNGTNLASATGSAFTLTNVQPAQAGNYAVQVTNSVGSIVSSNAVLTVVTAPFNGVANGSFEFGLSGWTTTGAVTVQGPPSGGTAAGTDGTHSANIGAFDATGSGLFQTLNVVPGTNYLLSFDSAANSPSLGRTSVVQVVVQAGAQVLASTLVTDVAVLPTGGTNGFTARSLSFVVPGGVFSLTLEFLDQSPNGGQGVDTMIDNVRLFPGQAAQPPMIVTQPQNQSAFAGGTASFSVAASGAAPLGYQWRFNGTNLVGASASTLTLTNVQLAQAGNYAVQVTNSVGSILSSNAILTVSAPINVVSNGSFEFGLTGWTTTGAVTVQGPPSGGTAAGTDGTHAANIGAFDATGSGLFQTVGVPPGSNYLLSFDSAANSPSLGRTSVVQVVVQAGTQVLSSTLVTDVAVLPTGGTNGFTARSLSFGVPAGVFSVTLEFLDQSPNGGQGVDTMIDNVRLISGQAPQPPIIVTQPQSQTVNAGSTASFSVAASSITPLGYQWRLNGTNLAGASNSTLTLTNVQLAQAGSYAVQVTNNVGSVVSSNATLTVVTAPFVGVTNGSFEFGLNGWTTTGAVTVQGPPSGGTAAGTDGTHAANIGAFDATGSGLFQTLSVSPGTNYLLRFDSAANSPSLGRTSVVQVVVQAGAQVLASVLVTDVAVLPAGGTNGFTARSLSFVVPAGVFSLTLEFLDQSPNGGQGVDTMIDNVRLIATQPPVIVSQPQSQSIFAGGTANFSVAASGAAPLVYQWRFNGTNLVGASSSTLTLTNVQPTQAGSYAVQVTNSVGSILSSNAMLTVLAPANGVTNGSFEFGLAGWTTTGAVTVQGPPSGGTAAGTDGTHAANIGAFDATGSGLFQTVNVLPGTSYLLSFDSAANSPSLGRTSVVQVVVQAGAQALSSAPVTDVAVLPTGGTNGFTPRSLSFVVPAGVFSVTLEFLDQSPNGGQGVDTMIDNVRLFPGQAQAPTIVTQPQSQTVNAGSTASFGVATSGTFPFSYQWRFNGTNLAGTSSSTLTLTNVQPTQAGSYSVQVTNSAGSIVSSNATLTVVTAPFVGVTNGSFEFGLNGWTTTGAVTVQGPPSGGTAAGTDGTHAANIGAFDATDSGLFQTLNVVPGTNYLLSFDSAANSPSLGRTGVVQVVVQAGAQVLASTLVTDVAVLPTGGTNGFTARNLSFVVPDGVFNVTLEFLDQSPNGGQGVDTMIDNVRIMRNRPPVASNFTAATMQNQAISIPAEKLAASAADPDGDLLSVSGVSATGTNGGSVILSGGAVTYTPASNTIGVDRFSYTVSDGRGAFSSAFVLVQIRSADQISGNMLPPVPVPGGIQVSFVGILGRTYTLQRSTAASGPWSILSPVTVGSYGVGTYTDTNAPSGSAFYRTVYP